MIINPRPMHRDYCSQSSACTYILYNGKFLLYVAIAHILINAPLKIIPDSGWRRIRARKLTFWSRWCIIYRGAL